MRIYYVQPTAPVKSTMFSIELELPCETFALIILTRSLLMSA